MMNPETELDDARKHLREVESTMIEQLAREIKFTPEEGCKCIPVLNQVRWWLERRNDALYDYACAVQGVEDASRTMIHRRTGEPLSDLQTLSRTYRESVEDALTVFADTVKTLNEPRPGCECLLLHRRMNLMMERVADAQNDLANASLDQPKASR
jgi:hypothetical protein